MPSTAWAFLLALTASLSLLILWRYWRLRRALDRLARGVRRYALGQESVLPTTVEPSLQGLIGALTALEREGHEKRAKLVASQARLSAVLEQIADGVLLVDARGIVTYANVAASRMFSESGVLVGRSLAEALRHYQISAAWRETLEKGAIAEATVTLAREQRTLHVIVAPDRTVPGGTLLLLQDITRLRQLEQVRRNFISNFSHELRTPLAAIRALAETLQEGALEDPPAARRFLERIVVEVDALHQMAQELLDLTRIESGNLTLKRRTIAPSALLRDAAARMRPQAERAGLMLTVQVAANLPLVQVDPARLGQALLNLLHNAIKFTSAGGRITLSAERHGNAIWLTVQDTGVGIPQDDLPHIFERFYKVDRARHTGGAGLGLAIVRHIVEAHGGRVWAESIEGQGSRFVLALPL